MNDSIVNPADLATINELQSRYPWLFHREDTRDARTVRECIEAYLQDQAGEVCGRFFAERAVILGRFAREFGHSRVTDCQPMQLRRWVFDNPGWKSACTQQRVNIAVQRVFNWAVVMRLTRENPFRGVHFPGGGTNRPMTDEEFRKLLGASDPFFRRFLFALKETGARPGELSRMKWSDIDWDRGVALLMGHKTAKKTGKPRVIVFTPMMVAMLRHMLATNPIPAAECLRRLLVERGGKASLTEVREHMRAAGFSYRATYVARLSIGATYHRAETAKACAQCGKTPKRLRRGLCRTCYYTPTIRARRAPGKGLRGPRAYVYDLPRERFETSYDGDHHVFLNQKATRWRRQSLDTKLGRLREKLGLPKSLKLYGLRHRFGTVAVKGGINLKVLATLMGHATTAMVDRHYVHIADDIDFLRQSAEQINKRPKP